MNCSPPLWEEQWPALILVCVGSPEECTSYWSSQGCTCVVIGIGHGKEECNWGTPLTFYVKSCWDWNKTCLHDEWVAEIEGQLWGEHHSLTCIGKQKGPRHKFWSHSHLCERWSNVSETCVVTPDFHQWNSIRTWLLRLYPVTERGWFIHKGSTYLTIYLSYVNCQPFMNLYWQLNRT